MKKTKKNIARLHEFAAYLSFKNAYCYPSPIFGTNIKRREVLRAWEKTARSMRLGKVPSDLFMYVNIPFCRCHCLYCSSYSFNIKNRTDILPEYLRRVYEEMDDFSAILKRNELTALYFGGGTPSLLAAPEISGLFENIRKRFYISPRTKIVFEASPFTLSREKLDVLKKYDIHELDLGVQTLDDNVLKKNSRPQSARETIAIIRYARKIGIRAVMADLMLGLPHQTLNSTINSMLRLIGLGVDGFYINPFRPLRWTRFSLEGHVYSSEQINARDKAEARVKELLERHGYKPTSAGYRKTHDKDDEKQFYTTQMTNNLLSFGDGAYSHALATLKYHQGFIRSQSNPLEHGKLRKITLPKNPPSPSRPAFQYRGIRMDKNREMHAYAYSYLEDLSLRQFKKIFHEDFRSYFKGQLAFLVREKWISIRKERIVFLKKDPFDRRFIRSFFIDEEYKKLVEKASGIKFDLDADYAALSAPFIS